MWWETVLTASLPSFTGKSIVGLKCLLTPKSVELETFKAAAARKKSSSANENQDFEICMRNCSV